MDTSYKSLLSAVQEGRLERAIELIRTFGSSDSQARPEILYSLLCTAIKNERTEITKLILTSGSKVNSFYQQMLPSNTPLHFAVINDDIEIVEMLLDKGAHINAKNEYGEIPLHTAIENEKMVGGWLTRLPEYLLRKKGEIVKLLLSRGANIDAQNRLGVTPLYVAAQKGYLEMVKILLKFGADVDSRNEYGKTALCVAAKSGYLEIVEILLKFGADVDSRGEYGKTALHFACINGYEKIVVALLEYGSDINIVSTNNCTPLDDGNRLFYSEGSMNCKEIAKIIKQQIIKMKTANLYVSRKNLLSISSKDGLSDYQNKCEEEMESMKSEKISNILYSNVSFHDILIKNISQLAIYARNENIVQILKSDDYKTKFPIYASMINSRFRKGVERKELLEQGNRFFHSFFNRLLELPYNCTEKIFSYLSDKDLRFLR